MYTYTLGLIYDVDNESDSTEFEIAIQELIDRAQELNVSVEAATLTTHDGTVIDMLQETDVEEARAHSDSPYAEDASAETAAEAQTQPSEPHEEETAAQAIPTNKEM